MRQGCKLALGALVFLLLALAVTAAASYVTKPYDAKVDKVEKNLYSEDADMEQTEVAMIGGSHAVNGFNPSVIWRDTRIKAYNFSFSGEPVYLTWYYLQQLFEKHDYKLVVFDLYYIGLKNQYFSRDSYVFDVLRGMRWSKDKVDFIQTCVSHGESGKYYFPLVTYHTRWSEIEARDVLRIPNEGNDYWLGSEYYFERYADEPVSFDPWSDTEESEPLPEYSEKYLRDIIELVQEHGCEILLVDLPHRYNDANAPDDWVEDEYRTYNGAKQIAAEYGVRFVQFDGRLLDEIGFVPEEDMYNKGHMNIYGSEKVSRYLGGYIRDHYEVTESSPKEHTLWDDYLEQYEKTYVENEIPCKSGES